MSAASSSADPPARGRQPLAVTFGCAGPQLTAAERHFFRQADPFGFILFGRNVETPDQVRALVVELREVVGRDAPVLIDQEGGRVARLRPPQFPGFPAARRFGQLHGRDRDAGVRAAWLNGRLLAGLLAGLGIDVDCAPVADLPVPGAHDVIGDRAFGESIPPVVALARATAEGMLAGGILPVVKHLPGHGRALVDSHKALPVVGTDRRLLEATDFIPFKALADLPLAMAAHVVFTAIDPDHPATTSALVIEQVIRRHIGFDGLLMSDDLGMQALSGTPAERTAAVLAAGCDLALLCNEPLDVLETVAESAPELTPAARSRWDRALAAKRPAGMEPLDELAAERDALLSLAEG